MRRVVLLLGVVLASLTVPQIVMADGSDSSGTHSYTSTCEGGLLRLTNTSDPTSTGNGVIEFRAAGATLTLSPGDSRILNPGEVSPNTPWEVVFFDLGEPYVFDGGTFAVCESPTIPLTSSVSVAEGCPNGEPLVNFTNTGTSPMYANIGTFAQQVGPGATVAAPWPTAHGDPYQQFDWHAYESPDPMGDIGPEFATGTVFLANACGVTTGPVDRPTGVVRNVGAAIPAIHDPSVGSAASGVIASVDVTLTETSIDGLPDDLLAGVIDVTVTDRAAREVEFSRVAPGTDPATFATDLVAVFEGGPFPDYWLNNSGVVGHSMITLDEGEYIVWFEAGAEGGDIITAPLTVGPGDNDAVIPATDSGSIRAGDYLFDADVAAGGTTVTFTNSSDNQFHHVVLIDFGTNDPALVEENLPAIAASEGEGPAPEGIDMAQVNDFAGSGVFGPGSSGTFDATFQDGHTYAAICYLQDREGGAPHVLQHQMYDIFQAA